MHIYMFLPSWRFFILPPPPIYLFPPCLRPHYLPPKYLIPVCPVLSLFAWKIHSLSSPFWLLQAILFRLHWKLASPWVWPVRQLESSGWREKPAYVCTFSHSGTSCTSPVSCSYLSVPSSVVLSHHRQPCPLSLINTSFPCSSSPREGLLSIDLTSSLNSCPLFSL